MEKLNRLCTAGDCEVGLSDRGQGDGCRCGK